MEWKRRGHFNRVTEAVTGDKDVMTLLFPPTDPYIFNLSEAAGLAYECMEKGMHVTIVGDYDCDGMMSTTIMLMYFQEAKVPCSFRLPRRFSEGYGLSEKIIEEISEGLVITVDNGIRAKAAIEAANRKGLTLIVTDHHEGTVDECPADIVVDPHAVEDTFSEYKDYCGAGLAYRFCRELFPDSKLHRKASVLAGIATVADVVPLIGDNRNLVKQSLKYINVQIVTKGFRYLLQAIDKEHYDEGDYGFTLGPTFNASGRLLDEGPDDVVKLLMKDRELVNDAEGREWCAAMSQQLMERNERRKELVKIHYAKALATMKEQMMEDDRFLVLNLPDCPEGIIGIIAGRLAENYARPAVVFSSSSVEGILKGSGRSGNKVHLKRLLDQCSDLLSRYGGHAGAAGLSIPEENEDLLRKKLNQLLRDDGFTVEEKVLSYDLEIKEADIALFLKEQNVYAPYGEGNRKPVFLIRGYRLLADKEGEYIRLIGKDKTSIKLTGSSSSCIGFGMAGQYREMGSPLVIDILGTLTTSYFMSKAEPQVEIMDLRPADEAGTENEKQTDALEALLFD